MDELDPQNEPLVSFDVTADPAGDLHVTIRGELDLASIDELQAAVEPLLERNPGRIIVEVSELRFADSSAIALWVRWATATPHFELRNPSALLRRVISGMGLSNTLVVSP